MKITKVEFNRFKTYSGYQEFEFDDGLILILGENGRGKSTIVDNIRLTLLGLSSAKTLSELINWDSEDKSFEIASEFEYDSSKYRSEMTLEVVGKSTNTNRKIFKDGELVVEGSSTVLEYLSNIFDPILVDNALFMKQSLTQIVDVSDSERRDIIKKMKDIDYSLKVKKEIEPEIERLKLDIIDIDKEIFALESKSYDPRIIKDLPFLKTRYDELVVNKDILTREINLIKDKLEEKESKELELSTIEKTVKNNELEIEDSNQQIGYLKGDIINLEGSKITDIKTTEEKIVELNLEATRLESAYGLEEKDLQVNHSEEKLATELDIETLEALLLQYPTKRIAKFDMESLDRYNKECIRIESEIKSLKVSINNMENGNCPTCNRPYEATTIEDYKTELEVKESELFEAESISSKLKTEKDEYDELVETNNINSSKKVELNNKISNEKSKLLSFDNQLEKDLLEAKNRTDKDIKNNKESLVLYEEKLSNINSLHDSKLATINNNIDSLTKEISRMTKENETLNVKIDRLKLELESYKVESISEKELDLVKITNSIKDYDDVQIENKTIKTHNKELAELELADKKVLKIKLASKDKLKNLLLENTEARNILLKDLPNYIISQSIGKLEDDMNETIDSIYYKSLNISLGQNKSSLTLKYGENKSNLKTAKGGLSGAESSLVNLAFIKSFNSNLDLKCLFLDEPDSAMTDENAEKLYESILEFSGDFSQVFLITHKPKLQSYISNRCDAQVVRI